MARRAVGFAMPQPEPAATAEELEVASADGGSARVPGQSSGSAPASAAAVSEQPGTAAGAPAEATAAGSCVSAPCRTVAREGDDATANEPQLEPESEAAAATAAASVAAGEACALARRGAHWRKLEELRASRPVTSQIRTRIATCLYSDRGACALLSYQG